MYAANRGSQRAMVNVAHLQWMVLVLATGLLTSIASLSIAYASGRLGWW